MAYFGKHYHPPGTPPGTLVRHDHAKRHPLRISVMVYNEGTLEEKSEIRAEDCHLTAQCRSFRSADCITWIHAQGHAEPAVMRQFGEQFNLHPLALEDVLNLGQRPKAESYDTQLFVVMSLPVPGSDTIEAQQVSIFLGNNYVVSFHAGEQDPFESVRRRLRTNAGRLRTTGSDSLLYALLDVVVDQGFPVLERYGERIEDLEEELVDISEAPDTLESIQRVKRELLLLRRMLWPQREVLNTLMRDGHSLIGEETKLYLRDIYDHTIQIMDLMETYRDMTTSMLDVYLSANSNRLNEVMRVLTVIATVFIPPTFLASVYGMNFDRSSPWNMPELGWRFGYAYAWGVILVMVVGMAVFFKRKRWFAV